MKRAFWIAVLVGPVVVGPALGQLPAVPAAPAIPAVPVVPVAPAAPRNIFSFFTMTPDQKFACKDHFCNSAIGKMASSASAPLSLMSGGLITNRCATHAIEDAIKNAPEGGAESTAAKIKKSEAEAAARRAAVRYLGTVDCSRFPDAQGVLISSLTEDPNECVRYEAALAFQNGCCCNKDTVKALTDVVAGTSRVVETSERVKAAAADALSQCEVVITPGPAIEDKKLEELKKVELTPSEVIERARDALAKYRAAMPSADPAPQQASAPRPTSVAAILSNAIVPAARATSAPVEAAARSPEPLPQPAVMNAVLTSQSRAVSEPATAPAPMPVSNAVPAERKPFFDNLTRALKGKQHTRAVLPADELPQSIATAPPTLTVESHVPVPLGPRNLNPGVALPLPVGSATPRAPAALPMLPGYPGAARAGQ